jgi:hypothetical protein
MVGITLMSYWWDDCDNRARCDKTRVQQPFSNEIWAIMLHCFEAPVDIPSLNYHYPFIHQNGMQTMNNSWQPNRAVFPSAAFMSGGHFIGFIPTDPITQAHSWNHTHRGNMKTRIKSWYEI